MRPMPGRRWAPGLATAVALALLLAAFLSVHGSTRSVRAIAHRRPTSGSGSRTGPGVARSGRRVRDWTRRENARPGSPGWVIPAGRMAGTYDLAGYADRVSVLPGEPFHLYVSSSLGDVRVAAFRLGYYGGAGARQVWASGLVRGHRQATPTLANDRMVTTAWTPSLTVPTTGWPEGTYLLKLVAGGRQKYVPVTVRSPQVAGRLVLLNATTTYQAYNTWGGYSLYYGRDRSFGTRSYRVSYDRPYDGSGAKQLLNFEAATIQRAERLGLPLAYLTSSDLDADPGALAGARGVVSLGHDEYWSTPMRAALERAADAGTNLAFLGADAVDWRVRLQPSRLGARRVMAGYKSAALDPVKGSVDTTTKWRQQPHPDPQNSLVGMLYECFPARGAMVVRDPAFFLFAGTGARKGSAYAGLVGTEIDRAYPVGGTPANLQVVAHSPVTCGGHGRTASDMSYYTRRSGAGVFSTGTMLWVRAIRGVDARYGITTDSSRFARTVTDTLLRAMSSGPMGRTHPASADLAGLHAPATTGTGTGGPVAH